MVLNHHKHNSYPFGELVSSLIQAIVHVRGQIFHMKLNDVSIILNLNLNGKLSQMIAG